MQSLARVYAQFVTRDLFRRQEGQTMAEYAVILSVITALVVLALALLGGNINTVIRRIADAISEVSTSRTSSWMQRDGGSMRAPPLTPGRATSRSARLARTMRRMNPVRVRSEGSSRPSKSRNKKGEHAAAQDR